MWVSPCRRSPSHCSCCCCPCRSSPCGILLLLLLSLLLKVLEPRRVAAKGAARRMAASLGEPVGGTVGYRVRLDSKVRGKGWGSKKDLSVFRGVLGLPGGPSDPLSLGALPRVAPLSPVSARPPLVRSPFPALGQLVHSY